MVKAGILHLLVLAGLLCGFLPCDGHAGPQIDVIIRFDDYSSGMATDSVLRFFMLFEKRSIPITFVVIPFEGSFLNTPGQPEARPLTEEKAWILKQMLSESNFEVAQHGFSHENNAKEATQPTSEFAGLALEEQMRRVTRGKELLEKRLGIRIRSFSPPWNTYDENTVLALKKCGFRVFSPGGPDPVLQAKYGMPVIGCGAGMGTLRARVEEARKGKEHHPIITALFHLSDIKDLDSRGSLALTDFAETLDWLKAQPDVHCRTLQEAAKKLRRSYSYWRAEDGSGGHS